jgi:acyl-CoA hydrolase
VNPSSPERKTVRETQVTLSQLMLPKDANFMGTIHGGIIMKLIDEAAGVAAYRFCRRRAVTAHIDSIDFHHPVQVGALIVLKAQVNYAGKTSMEVGVRVESEDLPSGDVTHTNSAYLVFVALDESGRPAAVPTLVAETDDDRRRWIDAEDRRARRAATKEAARARDAS